MAVLTVYPDAGSGSTTVDGYAAETGVTETWANIHDGAGDTSEDESILRIEIGSAANADTYTAIYRSLATYDASALGASANITLAVASLYGQANPDVMSISPTLNVYSASPVADNEIVAGDYDSLGTTAYCDTAIAVAAFSLIAYNDFTLNATGLAAISKTGITKLGFREATYDVADSAPVWAASSTSGFRAFAADEAGTTKDPKLVITYTAVTYIPRITMID